MKRILFVTQTIVYGGTEKHLVEFVQRIRSSDIHITILCFRADVFSAHIGSQHNVRVLCAGPSLAPSFMSCWKTLLGLAPHVIVFVNGWLGLFPWHSYLAARFTGARCFAIEQLMADPAPPKVPGGGLWNSVRRMAGWQARQMWKYRLYGLLANRTICVSDAVRQRLISDYAFSSSKTITIRNGVDLKRFHSSKVGERTAKGTGDGGREVATILTIGNLWKQKRVDVLLDALSIVVKSCQAVRCIVVGSGPLEEELRAQSIRLELQGIAQFVGHANDVRPYLEAADLFVLSSENEGLPLVLGEAMAYGLPCIATDVGGNKEIVLHGQTGLIVKPCSPEQLADAIVYLLTHHEERWRMGVNARGRVEEHFNIEDLMRQLKHVLFEKLDSLEERPVNLGAERQ